MSEAVIEITEKIESGECVEPFPDGKKIQRRYIPNPEDEELK